MEPPLLHILVVGFHHKKGCQVEFSYPELGPSAWKYLPTLALPDGSHNFGQDTVYFNLPSLACATETIFGISCYRQIPVEKLKNRTSDVTRSTVQKSVTALCSVPIYGYIEVKLSLIADCFFNQGDFERTEILVNAYEQLNACLQDNNTPYDRVPGLSPIESLQDLSLGSVQRNMFHMGLPLRDLILRWRQKVLVLFKLLLLQKRVVCFGSPVRPMCDLILSIASLHPQLMERGFREVACVKTSRPMSPMPDFPSPAEEGEDDSKSILSTRNVEAGEEQQEEEEELPKEEGEEPKGTSQHSTPVSEDGDSQSNSAKSEVQKLMRSFSRDASVDTLALSLAPLCSVKATEWGAPLPIFQGGALCLPYLSLPYMDLLTDPSVIGYFIGTSNILFYQKRNLADVLIDVESMQVDILDADLRRQITLSTEDLRFFDFILRHVQQPKENAEGSDRWIREQFQGYELALLKTIVSCANGSRDVEMFNGFFVNQFKRTNCFVDWTEANADFEQRMAMIPSGHPFAGTMSVQDVKLKLANSMQSSEGGRKLNQAVNNTSKAVGGALTHAKGAFSNWWSSMTTNQTTGQPEATTFTPEIIPEDAGVEAGEDDGDLEIVGNVPVCKEFSVSMGERLRGGQGTVPGESNNDKSGTNKVNEIAATAEEFLQREDTEQTSGPTPDLVHPAGSVFTV